MSANAAAQIRATDEQTPDQVLEALLNARYSCRGFLPQPVPRETIERILTLAQRTASWCNSQAWQVHITTGAATDRFRQALLAHIAANKANPDIEFPREYRGVYLDRRRECGFQLYEAVGVKRGDREASAIQARKNFEFFGAPHVAIISSDEPLGPYGAVDCGGYVANFLNAAQSVGVATIAQAALASFGDFVHAHFGIPADRSIVCGISFGYEDKSAPANQFRTRRAPLSETTVWVEE